MRVQTRNEAAFKVSLAFPLLLLGVAGVSSTALAQSPGAFTATGNMAMPRAEHTATLLFDGRVLITGGRSNLVSFGSNLASAELYDPSTDTVMATGNMTTPRAQHTATLLPDGRVLIVGGSRASAELYDPSTGVFTPTAGTNTDWGPTALLSNGRVLLAGVPTLFDPVTNSFAATGAHTAPIGVTAATLLPDGTVLVIGVFDDGCGNLAELYDHGSGTFSRAGSTPYSSGTWNTANLLTNGKVLVAGGYCEPGESASAQLYDPATGTFTASGDMITGRSVHTATLLPDGEVLMTGGRADHMVAHASAELYDPSTGTFRSAGNMMARRGGHRATLLSNGKVLITGGWEPSKPDVLASAELYRPLVLQAAPVLFSLSGDGRGQGAIQHANTYRIASVDDRAVAGEYLSIYLTGLTDGSAIPPQVAIGGRPAEITFFGDVPGYPGLDVINVRMPSGVAPGSAVPVRLNYVGRPSNEVTIGVR